MAAIMPPECRTQRIVKFFALSESHVNIYIAKVIAQNGNETIGNDMITEAHPRQFEGVRLPLL